MIQRLALTCLFISLTLMGAAKAQNLTIDLEVFGLNKNQFVTRQTLEAACASISQSGAPTAAAEDLLSTCDATLALDDEDPVLSEALDRLLPEEAFAISDALTDASDLQITNVNARINTLREQQNASLNIQDTIFPLTENNITSHRLQNLELFLSAQGSIGEINGNELQQDADIEGNQITLGADYRLTKQFIVGTGIGIFRHETQFINTVGGSDIEGTNATLYATYAREDLGYLDVVLDIGKNSFDFSRQINIEGENQVLATSTTDSSSVSLTVAIGKNFRFSAYELAPFARLGLTTAEVDAYSEQADSTQPGFGSILSIAPQSINSTTLSIGASMARVVNTSRFVLVPQISLEAELQTDSEKDPLTAFFVADPDQLAFSVIGETRDELYGNLGLGSTAIFARGKSAFAYLESRLAHDAVTQYWLKLGIRLEF
ncbi:MAG: autotransporter outer membrane beta-barrel domain-containing protein [Granulosicoccus sp.]